MVTMPFAGAQAAAVSPETLWAFGAMVVLWALVRPTTIRDYDNRPLPVDITARLFVVISYVVLYLLVIAATFVARDIITEIVGTLPRWQITTYAVHFLIPDLEKGAPFLSFFALGTLLTLPSVREIERTFMIWTHNARHLHKDVKLLSQHFRTCAFAPSDEERLLNVESLKAFNIFLTDTNTQNIDLPSVLYWRKSASLLRLLQAWQESGNEEFDSWQLKQLEAIATAHERKTRLALEIVRMLNLVSRGGGPERTLSEVSEILSGAPHGQPGEVADMEARLKGMVMALPEGRTDRPISMSSADFGVHLAQIQGYFAIEFRLLLEQLSPLAAKSVVLAGPHAAERLAMLKEVGFGGLGRIEPIRVDRILTLFLFALGAGFLIFYGLRFNAIRERFSLEVLDEASRAKLERNALFNFLTLSLVVAVAAMVGAVSGSGRNHVRAAQTPWLAYGLVGLFSVLMFFMIHGARLSFFAEQMSEARQIRMQAHEERLAREQSSGAGAIVTSSTRRQAVERTPLDQLLRIVPSAVLPFLVTVVICRLARMQHWPQPGPIAAARGRSALWERFWDGAALAGVFFVAYLLSRGIRDLIGLQPPPWVGTRSLINWQFLAPQLVLGFAIGAVVVREVRSSAHAQIVEVESAKSAPPSAAARPPRAPRLATG